MTERRDIGIRLENWSRVYQDRPRQGISPTAAYCDQLRREALGDVPVADRRKIDEADAHAIERGMRDLETKHRLILWWCYIRQAQPELVCRKVGIAHRPATIFINLFRDAQRAIESVVEKYMERQE